MIAIFQAKFLAQLARALIETHITKNSGGSNLTWVPYARQHKPRLLTKICVFGSLIVG